MNDKHIDTEQKKFVYDYQPGSIHFGRGSISDLKDALIKRNFDNALLVCGKNVKENKALFPPIKEILGGKLAGTYIKSSSNKSIDVAFSGLDYIDRHNIDVLISVGGGNTIDVSKLMCIVYNKEEPMDNIIEEAKETGSLSISNDNGDLLPQICIPTTLAGAELSNGAGILIPSNGNQIEALISDKAIIPDSIFYDPNVYETTPIKILRISAMNGFDKGIESLYSRNSNIISDITSREGLNYLRTGLPNLDKIDKNKKIMEKIIMGIILVQFDSSRKLSIIHAFGHSLRKAFSIHQGLAHGVMAPHVIKYIFENTDVELDNFTNTLVPDFKPCKKKEKTINAIISIRDSLNLPTQLREFDQSSYNKLSVVSKMAYDDPLLHNSPEDINPSISELETVLKHAW